MVPNGQQQFHSSTGDLSTKWRHVVCWFKSQVVAIATASQNNIERCLGDSCGTWSAALQPVIYRLSTMPARDSQASTRNCEQRDARPASRGCMVSRRHDATVTQDAAHLPRQRLSHQHRIRLQVSQLSPSCLSITRLHVFSPPNCILWACQLPRAHKDFMQVVRYRLLTTLIDIDRPTPGQPPPPGYNCLLCCRA